MSKAINAINLPKVISFGYINAAKNMIQTLRLMFVFLFFYMALEFFIFPSNGQPDLGVTPKDIIEFSVFGWIIFSLSRFILLGESLKTLKFAEVFSPQRQMALVFSVVAYASAFALLDFSNTKLLEVMVQSGGLNKGNIIVVLLFGYVSSIAFVGAYIAIAFASHATPLSYLYVCFHPSFLAKVFVVWLCCYAPIQGAYFGVHILSAIQGGDVADLVNMTVRVGFLDVLMYGIVEFFSFLFFASAMVKMCDGLLIFPHKIKQKIKEMQDALANKTNDTKNDVLSAKR